MINDILIAILKSWHVQFFRVLWSVWPGVHCCPPAGSGGRNVVHSGPSLCYVLRLPASAVTHERNQRPAYSLSLGFFFNIATFELVTGPDAGTVAAALHYVSRRRA